MSRCGPFPPSGYSWNGLNEEALADHLKVRQENARAEKERKKDERKRNKEMKKASKVCESRKRRYNDGTKNIHESQGLEDSGLTEEAELSVTLDSQYDSSDNSRNTKKIKPNCHTPTSTNFIREQFKFPSRPVSTSDRVTEHLADEKDERVPASGFSQIESQFRELIMNWVPPMQLEFDDQDWLNNRKLDKTEKRKATIDDLCDRSLTTASTCALYLPQAGVYALPYPLLF